MNRIPSEQCRDTRPPAGDLPAETGFPLLIYDGQCAFCRSCARFGRFLTGDRVRYEPFQSAVRRLPELDEHACAEAVQLVTPEGRSYAAAAAVVHALNTVPGLAWLRWLYDHAPGFALLTESLYRWVAARRRCRNSPSGCRRE